jgi:hypothetical protein
MTKSIESKKLSELTIKDIKTYFIKYVVVGIAIAAVVAFFVSKLYDMMGNF